MRKPLYAASAAAITLLTTTSAMAAGDQDIELLKKELKQTKTTYENQVKELEGRLETLEQNQTASSNAISVTPASTIPSAGNAFNPAISVVLNAGFNSFSHDPDNYKISGFALGDDAKPANRGFSLGESEVNFTSNIDDKFRGVLTASIADNAGNNSLHLEEAFIETLGMPYGFKAKAGRMLPVLGYLNEIHTHADTFIDRPLPYRTFFGGEAYNDDGLQLSVVLPTDLFAEIGGGAFRGAGFPAAGDDNNGTGAQTAFARIGGDIGVSQSWLTGVSFLHAGSKTRDTGGLIFNGDDKIYIADVKYTWSPNGNVKQTQLTLQGEYFLRDESGDYNGARASGNSSGWYAQAAYKFLEQWKAGYRYAALDPADNIPLTLAGTDLDSSGHKPYAQSLLLGFANSEFSEFRLQYTRDNAGPTTDDQAMLYYTISMGTHGAHQY